MITMREYTFYLATYNCEKNQTLQLKIAKLSSKVDGMQPKNVLRLWLWGGLKR